MEEQNPSDVLDVRIVGMPNTSAEQIRNQLIVLGVGAVITSVGAIVTESLIGRMRKRRKIKEEIEKIAKEESEKTKSE